MTYRHAWNIHMPRKWLLLSISLAILPVTHCPAQTPASQYQKAGLSFTYPTSWIVSDDVQYPGSQRSLSIETPRTALMTIEVYTKQTLTAFPEYRQYDASLVQFARRYDGRDITAKLQTNTPIKQAFVHRHGSKGLKETRLFRIGDLVKKTMISEFYRFDTKGQIVFVTVTAPKSEWRTTITGFDTILKTFKYH